MPQRSTSMSTCPLPGSGCGRSITRSSPALQPTAFMRLPRPAASCREGGVVEVEAGAAPGRLQREAGPERRVAMLVEVIAAWVGAGPLEEDLVGAPRANHLEEAAV